MKNIYVTSVDRYSGKTAVCLALGKRLQAANVKVGYLKPLPNLWEMNGQFIQHVNILGTLAREQECNLGVLC